MNHSWCNDSIVIVFKNGNIMILNVSTWHKNQFKVSERVKDMHAIYLSDIGYIIAVIDEKCINFITVCQSEWQRIAIIDYTADWIINNQVPKTIRITPNGKYSIVCIIIIIHHSFL